MAEIHTSRLGKSWLVKTLLFLVLLLGFGVWGLVDALYVYPRRGELDASLKFTKHLQAAQAAGMLTTSDLKVPDPKAALAELRAKLPELEARVSASGPEARRDEFMRTRLRWLESLALMWKLNSDPKRVETEAGPPVKTLYFELREGQGAAVAADGTRTSLSPMDLLSKLAPKLNTTANVSPLSPLDLLFQWVFVIIGFGGGLYMLVTLGRAASKRFTWESDSQTLTVPGGASFTPADVKEFDKRLWHKFFVTVNLKDGSAHKLDLLRYQPLEEWVLTMEKTAFPEQAAESDKPTDDTPNAGSDAAGGGSGRGSIEQPAAGSAA